MTVLVIVSLVVLVGYIGTSYLQKPATNITEQTNYLMHEMRSSYVVENLKGDTINTWISWKLVSTDTFHIHVLKSDLVTDSRLKIIHDAIFSEEKSGIVYALDAHPLAIEQVRKKASQRGLSNIRTILSDGQTGLADNYVDIVLLYDVFHSLIKPDLVLKELNRILKEDDILSFINHSKPDEFVSMIKNSGLFKLQREGRRTISFSKIMIL